MRRRLGSQHTVILEAGYPKMKKYPTVVRRLTETPASTEQKPSVCDALLTLDKTPEGSLSSEEYRKALQKHVGSSSQSSSCEVPRGGAAPEDVHEEEPRVWKFDLEVISGALRWCDMSRPHISSADMEGLSLSRSSDISFHS